MIEDEELKCMNRVVKGYELRRVRGRKGVKLQSGKDVENCNRRIKQKTTFDLRRYAPMYQANRVLFEKNIIYFFNAIGTIIWTRCNLPKFIRPYFDLMTHLDRARKIVREIVPLLFIAHYVLNVYGLWRVPNTNYVRWFVKLPRLSIIRYSSYLARAKSLLKNDLLTFKYIA